MNSIEYILKMINVPDFAIARCKEIAHEKHIAVGQFILQEGDVFRKLAFIDEGLFRYVYISEQGEESTLSFSAENDCLYDCEGMRTGQIAKFSIEALEDSRIWEVDYKKWVEPFEHEAWWQKILLDMTTLELNQKTKREIELMELDAKERYKNFLEEYKDIHTRIKNHIIASYLGITAVSLSRIRKDLGLI